jgi:SAM-dependent methyltransferase
MSELHDRIRDFWDRDAETYDRSPTHAASDPVEAAAWRAALRRHLPAPKANVLDAGAGTGSMSLLLAELGYRVTALDLSPEMLARARAKAEELGLTIDLVVGKAEEPPAGPFDAVVERNMLWTNPEPLRTLEAWRAVTVTGGTLLLLEGIPGGSGMTSRARGVAAEALRRALGVPEDHHADYDPDIVAALPLAGASSPAPLIDVVAGAGWGRIRIERLRDVEWARRMAGHPVLGPLEAVPLYALIAEA